MLLSYHYFAKTNYRERDRDPDAPKKRHLVPYHLLDVAACCKVLLNSQPHYLQLLSDILGLPKQQIREWIVFCVSLHDIAKISYEFQAKNPRPDCDALGYPTCEGLSPKDLYKVSEELHHSHAGLGVWLYDTQGILEDRGVLQNVHYSTSADFFSAFASHHGAPKQTNYRQHFHQRFQSNEQGRQDLEAIEELVEHLIGLFDLTPFDLSKSNADNIRKASWLINGIVNQADWLGSDMDTFGWVENPKPLGDYWERAKEIAERKYTKSGLAGVNWKNHGFDDVFSFPTPLPVQEWADNVELHEESSLFFVEAVTGSGKTEGGLTLASRIAAAFDKSGIYFALPTQGSAEKMFDRVLDDFCQKAFEWPPTVALAHSAANSNQRYNKIQSNSGLQYGLPDADGGTKGTTTDFLSFSRKACLLSQIGVGTVDQLILSSLPRNHQTLRLSGLMDKVVIIDEIHSYQEYQQLILERFLELAGEFGIPVLMLSATLPTERKERLISAFRDGNEGVGTQLEMDYPLYTAVGRENGVYDQGTVDLDSQDLNRDLQWKLSKDVAVKNIYSKGYCQQELTQRASDGDCVCWIRNTVKNAINTYETLREEAPEHVDVLLAHSKFTQKHRMENDQLAERLFGSDSTASQRSHKIVISTQVYEQSLDLDFDFMISDLAPIEVLIQRIGRLCRHFRPGSGGEDHRHPEFWAHGPYYNGSNTDLEEWVGFVSGHIAPVYRNVMDLWRTQQAIEKSEGQFRFPSESRELIEWVHDWTDDDILEEFEDKMGAYRAELYGEECKASRARLNFDGGWYVSASESWEDNEVWTRLMEPTQTFYLCRIDDDDNLTPYDSDHWKDSKITIKTRYADKPQVSLESQAEDHGLDWLLRKGNPVLVEDNGIIRVKDEDEKPRTMQYTRETGLKRSVK